MSDLVARRIANEVLKEIKEAKSTHPTLKKKIESISAGVGEPGKSIEYSWNGTRLGIKQEGEEAFNYVDLKGAQGLTGLTGLKGDIGPKGDTGLQGIKGDTGLQGIPGERGMEGIKGDTGLKGDTGQQGIQGIQGQQGIPGNDGYTPVKGIDYFDGIQGMPGETGTQGIQGVKGDTGEQGIQGLPGVDGYTPIKGVDYFDGLQGDKGDPGEAALNVITSLPTPSAEHRGKIYFLQDNNIFSIPGFSLKTFTLDDEIVDGIFICVKKINGTYTWARGFNLFKEV
jgi:hypothetical protein